MNRKEEKRAGHSAPLSQRDSAALRECVTVSCGPFSPRGVLFPLLAPAPSPANPFETHTRTHISQGSETLYAAAYLRTPLSYAALHTHTHTCTRQISTLALTPNTSTLQLHDVTKLDRSHSKKLNNLYWNQSFLYVSIPVLTHCAFAVWTTSLIWKIFWCCHFASLAFRVDSFVNYNGKVLVVSHCSLAVSLTSFVASFELFYVETTLMFSILDLLQHAFAVSTALCLLVLLHCTLAV